MTTKQQAVIYCRISQDAEALGLGVARQERACRELCASRGWAVHAIYTDNDTSAFTGKPRPGFDSSLAAVESGAASYLVTYRSDRLYRRTTDLERVIAALEARGIADSLVTVASGSVDLTNADGRMVARMLGAAAQAESERSSERIRAEAIDSARQGKPGGGRRPYGFRKAGDSKGYTEHEPAEAAAIQEAARRLINGESLYGIIQDWAGRPSSIPPRASGIPWSAPGAVEALSSTLRRGRIAGLREHRGEIVALGQWPAIIDRATWDAVRERLSAKSAKKPPRAYLLTGGLAVCGLCDSWLHAAPRSTSKGSQRGMGCLKTKGGCGRVHVLAALAEEHTIQIVAHYGNFKAMARAALAGRSTEAQEARSALHALDERYAHEYARYMAGDVPERAWLAGLDSLRKRQAELEALLGQGPTSDSLALLAAEVQEASSFARDWLARPLSENRARLEAMVSEVRVYQHTHGTPRRFDACRVAPVLRYPVREVRTSAPWIHGD